MAYSFEKLVEVFEKKGFTPNNYFTVDSKYRLVEVVSLGSAISIVIDIGTKYQIDSRKGKHEYVLTKRDVTGDLLQGLSDEADIRSTYREIDHISKALESEDRLNELYDKPISLKGDEDRSKEKFASTVRQIRRFRLCVRNIPYKLCLFDDDCMCLLNLESEVESYFVNDYKPRKRKMFIVTSLENFFNSTDIAQDTAKIYEQFYGILSENQKYETTKIQVMVDAKKNILNQSKKIIDYKKRIYDKIVGYQKQHQLNVDAQKDIQRKIKDQRMVASRGVAGDVDRASRERKMYEEMEAIEEKRKDVIRAILETRKELDEICLVVDNVLFDNMLMLTKIAHNFRILDKIKV